MEPADKHFLSHGSEWPEHEDYLIGDQAGLQRLQQAISQALDHGESELDVGDFVGVRLVESVFFERETPHSIADSVVFWTVIAVILGIFLVGLVSLIAWFF